MENKKQFRKVIIYKAQEPCGASEVKKGDTFKYLPIDETDDLDCEDILMVAHEDAKPNEDDPGGSIIQATFLGRMNEKDEWVFYG